MFSDAISEDVFFKRFLGACVSWGHAPITPSEFCTPVFIAIKHHSPGSILKLSLFSLPVIRGYKYFLRKGVVDFCPKI